MFPSNFLKAKRAQAGKGGLILPQIPKSSFKVLAAMCVHRGVEPDAWISLERLRYCADPAFFAYFHTGDALIDRARSQVATRFLMSQNFDVLLFLDDDIVYEPDAPIKAARLVHEQNLDIVCAAYAKKQSENTNLNIKCLDDQPMIFGEGGHVQEIMYGSTGFMAINKKVLRKMAETMPLCHPEDMNFYPFFQPFPYEVDKGNGNKSYIYLSEDWAFCQRARDLGFKVWVDCSTKLQHIGKYKYDWNDMFREKKPEVAKLEYGDASGLPFSKILK